MQSLSTLNRIWVPFIHERQIVMFNRPAGQYLLTFQTGITLELQLKCKHILQGLPESKLQKFKCMLKNLTRSENYLLI